jgi:hypothetical protein
MGGFVVELDEVTESRPLRAEQPQTVPSLFLKRIDDDVTFAAKFCQRLADEQRGDP